MEFDKTKVYSSVNADEVKPGSKGFVGDTLFGLREKVEGGPERFSIVEVVDINKDNVPARFCVQNDGYETWNLFYLVKEPEPKKPRPYRDTAEMLLDFRERFNLIGHPDRLPPIWIKNKSNDICYLVVRVADDNVTFVSDGGAHTSAMDNLFNNYTYLDGSLIGTKEA